MIVPRGDSPLRIDQGAIMETLLPLIIQAVSGAAGSGIVGNLLKTAALSIGPKLIAGAIGGIGGGQVLGSALGTLLGGDPAAGMDVGAILGHVVAGGLGGGVLTAVAGAVMGARKK